MLVYCNVILWKYMYRPTCMCSIYTTGVLLIQPVRGRISRIQNFIQFLISSPAFSQTRLTSLEMLSRSVLMPYVHL